MNLSCKERHLGHTKNEFNDRAKSALRLTLLAAVRLELEDGWGQSP